ncbi:18S rRNA (guanine-N(7))-methyltransferase [Chironomus tepperi]|uniref:18S rRNA (guanine-N(7))-methyltransferase n=1 Tax=Chironomus tepperi TaxID=113505 RepID=UPI00391F2B06
MAKRPEHLAPPEIFYNDDEAKKYSQNTRIIEIQEEMSERAYELLLLPEDEPQLILDVGCGSGLSGSVLEENGHYWIGIDISQAMLDVAVDREVEGDLILGDMGEGMPFKAGSFDGALSISALQWLCNADKTHHVPQKRLYQFFTTLYACLTRNARAVFQFYPENAEQIDMITSQALRSGFHGGVVVDYPNSSKSKKYYLVLMTGGVQQLPPGLGTEESSEQIPYSRKRELTKNIRGKNPKRSKDWIMHKKERRRQQGNDTRADSKYTGRKRSGRF